MAGKGKIENLKPFQKGQSGNYSGRPKREFTADDLAIEIEKCLLMTRTDLAILAKDESTKGVTAIAASATLRAINTGDWNQINTMLDRCIGKVKDVSEVHQHNYDDEFDKAPKENIIELLRRSNTK